MSEALVLAQDSALARAKSGASFVPSNIPEHLLRPADEEDDFHGIEVRTPVVDFSGKYGTFPGPGEEKDAGPKEVQGIALARLQTAVLFKPGSDKEDKFRAIGFRALLDGEHKSICMASDTRQPASLNPALTDEQRAEALKLGIHGATGKKCLGCPMAQFSSTIDGRPCKKGVALLWLDAQRGEPVVLRAIAYKSVKALEDFLGQALRGVSIYGHVLALSSTKIKEKGNEYYQLTARILEPVSPELIQTLREKRAELYPMLVQTTEEHIESHDEDSAPVPISAPPSGGRTLDVDDFGPAEDFSDVPF